MNNQRILIKFTKNDNNFFCDDFESLEELRDFLNKNMFIHIKINTSYKETERVFNRDRFESMMYDEGFNDYGIPHHLNTNNYIKITKK